MARDDAARKTQRKRKKEKGDERQVRERKLVIFAMHATQSLQSGPSTSGECNGAMRRRLFVKGLSDEDMHDDSNVESLFASFGLLVRSVERFGPYKERVFYRGN